MGFEKDCSCKQPSWTPSSAPPSLQRIVRSAERVIGCHLPSFQVLHDSRARKRAGKIIANPFRPLWQMVQVNHDHNLTPPEQFLPLVPWPSSNRATWSTMILSSMDIVLCAIHPQTIHCTIIPELHIFALSYMNNLSCSL